MGCFWARKVGCFGPRRWGVMGPKTPQQNKLGCFGAHNTPSAGPKTPHLPGPKTPHLIMFSITWSWSGGCLGLQVIWTSAPAWPVQGDMNQCSPLCRGIILYKTKVTVSPRHCFLTGTISLGEGQVCYPRSAKLNANLCKLGDYGLHNVRQDAEPPKDKICQNSLQYYKLFSCYQILPHLS